MQRFWIDRTISGADLCILRSKLGYEDSVKRIHSFEFTTEEWIDLKSKIEVLIYIMQERQMLNSRAENELSLKAWTGNNFKRK